MELLDTPIYTVHKGNNSGLIKKVVALYFKQREKIVDVTWGKGAFWKEVDLTKINVVGTDIKTGTDFRDLPYKDNLFNHSVIDPPYARITNLKSMVDCYNTARFTTHEEIIKLYEDGLKELTRITKEDGYILVKCQAEIEDCK
ncbi:tRNA G10 N-methylase Trm11 [Clostridium saccharoperbutylacetonicum]|uniref:DNA modification methylase n=1 Tax=Clostridium saccharoperbutylacetonicum N1-4(HMT) TaxID=931276 RepID=M1MLI9_9CLOT|nr:hypothetical protein [Clostridium saccharoperbutylacetonicum]AGF55651.1 hypothetical protein Cspa_c18810 [Clostridium saccharoperbutylacetonicum N1-4(HMT)]NRT63624.1 tRNA G10 N-methylase Trm11 [Clostridium saccharoperbutylacetonicum]NSB26987.1 tRNA G10 N-methylase Trm11 [Clostridium saccharoperbutylacetonicum]NSB40471.1 tRNA G10 N-methylase Trm11 [Clostridium saccharoperbutylacetonicum]